nr:hypothetical protein 1DG000086 [Iridovirus CN01]UPA43840.1 hypothetical protein L2A02_0086 [Iridovirus CN01]
MYFPFSISSHSFINVASFDGFVIPIAIFLLCLCLLLKQFLFCILYFFESIFSVQNQIFSYLEKDMKFCTNVNPKNVNPKNVNPKNIFTHMTKYTCFCGMRYIP